jgi:hypothetical protein
MLNKKRKEKILFLKKILKAKNENKKKKILKSIIHNNEINTLKKTFSFLIIEKLKNKKNKKNCIGGISKKNINKKSKFSRFFIHKINNNNLNQNFKIYEK